MDELLEASGAPSWLAAMLEAEAALARAAAAAEVIPADAAAAITGACRPDGFDMTELARQARLSPDPVGPLVGELRTKVAPEVRRWVQWGASNLDILDTAAMLVCRRTLGIIEVDLGALAGSCAALARAQRDTPNAALRLPSMFGLEVAAWLSGVMDARDGLARLHPRLAVQLGGAIETVGAYGDAGLEVMARMAVELDLVEPVMPWSRTRGRIAEIAGALGVVAGTVVRIALDVGAMTPAGAAALDTARDASALAATLLGATTQDAEGTAGAWPSGWAPLADLLAGAGRAVVMAGGVVAGIEVDELGGRRDLDAARGAAGQPPTELGSAGVFVDRVLDAYDAWKRP